MTRTAEVSCDEHGPMDYDATRFGWYCPVRCGTWLPDEEVARLTAYAPHEAGDPVKITVT